MRQNVLHVPAKKGGGKGNNNKFPRPPKYDGRIRIPEIAGMAITFAALTYGSEPPVELLTSKQLSSAGTDGSILVILAALMFLALFVQPAPKPVFYLFFIFRHLSSIFYIMLKYEL
jgi:hypothetical protein